MDDVLTGAEVDTVISAAVTGWRHRKLFGHSLQDHRTVIFKRRCRRLL
jgi:hypothetical protein